MFLPGLTRWVLNGANVRAPSESILSESVLLGQSHNGTQVHEAVFIVVGTRKRFSDYPRVYTIDLHASSNLLDNIITCPYSQK